MSRARDREEFVAVMAREGVPLDVARALMRAGATLHRLAELACSSEAADRDRVPCPDEKEAGACLCVDYGSYDHDQKGHGTVPRIAVRERATRLRVLALCVKHGLTPVFSGDPRGAVVKLTVPSGRTNDWGQMGICVP